MSNNLLKCGVAYIKNEDVRIIDADEIMKGKRPASTDVVAPLSGELRQAEDSDPETEQEMEPYVPKETGPTPEELKERALLEIEEMRQSATAELENERARVLQEAKDAGYEEGRQRAEQEAQTLKSQLEAREKELESQYEVAFANMEEQLVDTLSGVYEHLFKVELSQYKELILHLVTAAMHRAEGAKTFLIHVSKEDFPFIRAAKLRLMEEGAVGSGVEVDVTEDPNLSVNDALVETENGIFDCSLDTELSELTRKLKLLSYEKPV